MKLLFVLFTAQLAGAECPAALTLHGVDPAAAARVQPYVACINSTIGTEEQIRISCTEARAKALVGSTKNREKAKLERALRWLDAMIKERANCETHLGVEA